MTPGAGTLLPALLVSSTPVGESDSLVRCFSSPEGAIAVKARGLRKARSKLAHLLKPADELRLRLVHGRGTSLVLAGASVHKEHPRWREDLDLMALYWYMTECIYISSNTSEMNESMFQLTVNILRSEPMDDRRLGAAAVFCIKLLFLHGLLPDLDHCSASDHALAADEPVHLLPSGEGVIGLEAYNRNYARTGTGLIRLEPGQLARWRQLRSGSLLGYLDIAVDKVDAALIVHFATRLLSDTSGSPIKAAAFLTKQWKLPEFAELLENSRRSSGRQR